MSEKRAMSSDSNESFKTSNQTLQKDQISSSDQTLELDLSTDKNLLSDNNTDKEQQQPLNKKKKPSLFANFDRKDYLFIFCIGLMRVSLGFFATVISITILDLANNLGVSPKQLTPIVTGKSFGSMLGSILVSLYQHYLPFEKRRNLAKYPKSIRHKFFDRSTIMGLTQIIGVFTCILIPLVHSVESMGFLVILTGILYGFMDIGAMAMVIDTWGNELAGSMVQLYSFLWVIGSFTGPFIFSPFQEVQAQSSICEAHSSKSELFENLPQELKIEPLGNNSSTTIVFSMNNISFDNLPSVFWPWFITAVGFAVQSIALMYAGFSDLRRNLKEKHARLNAIEMVTMTNDSDEDSSLISLNNQSKEREDEKDKVAEENYISPNIKYPFFKYDLWVLLAIFCLYFCIGSSGHLYFEYVYSYAVCVRKFSNKTAASLNSAYFAAQMVARFSSIFLAARIDSKKLLLFFGVGEAVSAFLLYSVRGTAPDVKSLNDILFFIGTCLLGFSDSPLYGAGVAVSTTYLSMTGIYQCIFALGNYSGQLSLLSLVGDIVNEAERWLGLSLMANFGVFVAIYVLVFPCKWLKNSLSK